MPYRFRFSNEEEDKHLDEPLTTYQCRGHTKTGARCKRRCAIPFEYCPAHLASNLHLKVKPSLIEGGGKGLFAYDPTLADNAIVFKTNQTICRYNGGDTTLQQLDEEYGENATAPYAVVESGNHVVDAAFPRRGVGSLANHRHLLRNNDATLSSNYNNHTVVLKARKNIRNGQEIYVWYGNAYHFDEAGISFHTKYYKN